MLHNKEAGIVKSDGNDAEPEKKVHPRDPGGINDKTLASRTTFCTDCTSIRPSDALGSSLRTTSLEDPKKEVEPTKECRHARLRSIPSSLVSQAAVATAQRERASLT